MLVIQMKMSEKKGNHLLKDSVANKSSLIMDQLEILEKRRSKKKSIHIPTNSIYNDLWCERPDPDNKFDEEKHNGAS